MSIMSDICAQHHREIVTAEVAKQKSLALYQREWTTEDVTKLLTDLETTINSQISE